MYGSLEELPKGVKSSLPTKAQVVYKDSFNGAIKSYGDQADYEKAAHKVAWSAVREKYEKHGDSWRKKKYAN